MKIFNLLLTILIVSQLSTVSAQNTPSFTAVPYIGYRSFGSANLDAAPQIGVEIFKRFSTQVQGKIGFGFSQTADGQSLRAIKSVDLGVIRTLPPLLVAPNIEFFLTTGVRQDASIQALSFNLGLGGRFLFKNKENIVSRADITLGAGSLSKIGFERPVTLHKIRLRPQKSETTPVKTITSLIPPPMPKAPIFRVMAGERASSQKMKSFSAELRQRGYSTYTRISDDDSNKTVFQAQVMYTQEHDEAKALLMKLHSLGYKKAFILTSEK